MATSWRQARVFHGFAMLRRNKETNRVSPSFHRQLFQWGNNNSTGPIFTKQSQRTKCIINEGVICEASFTHGSSLCCRSDPALFARLLFISQVRGLRALLSCLPVFSLLFTGKRDGLDDRSDIRERFLPHAGALMRATVSPKTRRR